MTILALIPARMGSQRLPRKNLQLLDGLPLITRAIRKCKEARCFDSIWVSSEHPDFGTIAAAEGVNFHRRPNELGSNHATSEQYIREFLEHHACDFVVQVHSIAPLLTPEQITSFTEVLRAGTCDVLLSYVPEQIECALDGKPVNFSFDRKTNSQELQPIQRITWSITAWRSGTYLDASRKGTCATYAGRIGYFAIDRAAGHIIKTQEDLRIAEALLHAMSPHQETQ